MMKVHVCDVMLPPKRCVPQIDLKLDRYWELSAMYSGFGRVYGMTSRIEVKLCCLHFNIRILEIGSKLRMEKLHNKGLYNLHYIIQL